MTWPWMSKWNNFKSCPWICTLKIHESHDVQRLHLDWNLIQSNHFQTLGIVMIYPKLKKERRFNFLYEESNDWGVAFDFAVNNYPQESESELNSPCFYVIMRKWMEYVLFFVILCIFYKRWFKVLIFCFVALQKACFMQVTLGIYFFFKHPSFN